VIGENAVRQTLHRLSQSRRLAGLATGNRLAWRAASRFVAGETLEEAVAVVRDLNAAGLSATLDFLGENVATQAEAEASAGAYLEAVKRIREAGIHSGISLKLTALGLDLADDLAATLLAAVVGRAADLAPPVFVRIDMEGSPYTARTLAIFERVFREHRNVGVVIQSYLFRSAADVERLIELGAHVRVVKGAYKEPEQIAWPAKADVDASFLRLTERLLNPAARERGVYTAVASHDPAIIGWVKSFAEQRGIGRDQFEFQLLYGIRRDLQTALAAEGYRVRVYVPYGRQWYPYFVRRLAERPENMAFVARNVWRELRS
jgi:proline dehydrogenase